MKILDSMFSARYWYVIIHPPARLDKLREAITARATDIKEVAMLWSHRNVKQIREQNNKLLEHNQQLLTQNNQMDQKIDQLKVENGGLRRQIVRLEQDLEGNRL